MEGKSELRKTTSHQQEIMAGTNSVCISNDDYNYIEISRVGKVECVV